MFFCFQAENKPMFSWFLILIATKLITVMGSTEDKDSLIFSFNRACKINFLLALQIGHCNYIQWP